MDEHVGKGLKTFLYANTWMNMCFPKLKLFIVTTEDMVLLGEEVYLRQKQIPEWAPPS